MRVFECLVSVWEAGCGYRSIPVDHVHHVPIVPNTVCLAVFRQVGVSCLVMYFFGFRQLHAFSLFFRLRGGVPAEHEGLAGAAASLSSAKAVPHLPDSMFVAEMMLRLS